MIWNELPILIEETKAVISAVGHQNVPNVIHGNPGRVVELPSSAPESFDRLEIVGVHDETLIQAKVRKVQVALGEGEEPAHGLAKSVTNK